MHSKFKGHRPFGIREEDCFKFLPCMGMAAILIMWPGPFEQNYVPPSHRSSRRTTDDDDGRQTTEAYLSYKLTKWAFGSGELQKRKNYLCAEPGHLSSLFAWRNIGSLASYSAHNQTRQMRRLIWVITMHTYHFVAHCLYFLLSDYKSRIEEFNGHIRVLQTLNW